MIYLVKSIKLIYKLSVKIFNKNNYNLHIR